MKDDKGIVQIFSIPTLGGTVRQVTHLAHAIQSQFNVSPDGKQLSAVADNSIWLIEIVTGNAVRVTEKSQDENAPVGGALWRHDGKVLVFNRYIGEGDQRYLQIIKIDLE
jgi:Tol biopolymer transport system component